MGDDYNRLARPQQQAQQPQKAAAPQAEKAKEPERKRERRVVDTSAVQVNANRFADVDNLVSEKVQNYQGGKQRIGGGKGKQQKQQKGNFKSSSTLPLACAYPVLPSLFWLHPQAMAYHPLAIWS